MAEFNDYEPQNFTLYNPLYEYTGITPVKEVDH